MEWLKLGATLCILAVPVRASILPVDLCEPDPYGVDELPGITEDEVEALREAAGPGPEDLGRRLASTGLDPARLTEWAPYLSAGASSASWDFRASADGEGSDFGTARQSMRVTTGRCRLELAWRRTRRSPLGQEQAWMFYRPTNGTEIVAGAIGPRWTGPAPWEDPVARGRAVYGDDSDCTPAGATGMRGVSFRAPGFHGMAWTGPAAGRGWMTRVGGERFHLWGAVLAHQGYGGGVGFPVGPASITAAAHRSAAAGRFVRFGLRSGATAFALAAPIGGNRGSDGARIDVRSSIRARRLAAWLQASCIRPFGSSAMTRSATTALERIGSADVIAIAASWRDGPARITCRLERKLGLLGVKLAAGRRCGGGGPTDLHLDVLRSGGPVQGDCRIGTNAGRSEAGFHLSAARAGVRVRLGFQAGLSAPARDPRWDLTLWDRGG